MLEPWWYQWVCPVWLVGERGRRKPRRRHVRNCLNTVALPTVQTLPGNQVQSTILRLVYFCCAAFSITDKSLIKAVPLETGGNWLVHWETQTFLQSWTEPVGGFCPRGSRLYRGDAHRIFKMLLKIAAMLQILEKVANHVRNSISGPWVSMTVFPWWFSILRIEPLNKRCWTTAASRLNCRYTGPGTPWYRFGFPASPRWVVSAFSSQPGRHKWDRGKDDALKPPHRHTGANLHNHNLDSFYNNVAPCVCSGRRRKRRRGGGGGGGGGKVPGEESPLTEKGQQRKGEREEWEKDPERGDRQAAAEGGVGDGKWGTGAAAGPSPDLHSPSQPFSFMPAATASSQPGYTRPQLGPDSSASVLTFLCCFSQAGSSRRSRSQSFSCSM